MKRHSVRISTHLIRLSGLVTVLLLSLLACSSDPLPTQPDNAPESAIMDGATASRLDVGRPGDRGFFPLSVGNRWTYQTEHNTFVMSDSCDTLPSGIIICQGQGSLGWGFERRELIGTETMFGREYVVEAQKVWSLWSIGSPDTTTYWTRYRQDYSGLYSADVSVNRPPGPVAAGDLADSPRVLPLEQKLSAALAANGLHLTLSEAAAYDEAMNRIQRKLEKVAKLQGWLGLARSASGSRRNGAGEHELTVLRYPLHQGQTWNIREEPDFSARVVGHELLKLPAGRLSGWRIRIESEYFDSEDKVHFWCGRTGILKMSASGKSVALDEWGNRVGTVYWSQSSELLDFELIQP